MLIATEPEETEKLQVGRLKQISGNDQVQARDLFQSLFYFTPQFGIFFQCNSIPQVSKVDGGVQRRLRVIEFPFDFVENPILPHQRQADNNIKDVLVKSLAWRQQFVRILIHIFITEVKDQQSLHPPDSVSQASKSFLDSCNPVAEWLASNCTLTGNRNDVCSLKSIFAYYVSKGGNIPKQAFNNFVRLCGFEMTGPQRYESYRGIVLEPPPSPRADSIGNPFVPDE